MGKLCANQRWKKDTCAHVRKCHGQVEDNRRVEEFKLWLRLVTPCYSCTPIACNLYSSGFQVRQLTNRLSFSVPGWTKWGEGDWNFDWHGLQSLVGYEKIDVSMVYLVCWGSLWYYGSLIMTYLQIPWFLLVHVPFLVTAIPTDLLLQEPFEWFWKYPHECIHTLHS